MLEGEGKSKGKKSEKDSYNRITDNVNGHDRNKKQRKRRSDDEEQRGLCVK